VRFDINLLKPSRLQFQDQDLAPNLALPVGPAFLSRLVGIYLQDQPPCSALAAHQAGRMDWRGGENADPSNKQYIVGNDIIERRGYSIAKYDAGNDKNDNKVLRDRQEYFVRSWLSLLGGNASTNVVDTQMLGIVTIGFGTCININARSEK
jgi:hypothetical protein